MCGVSNAKKYINIKLNPHMKFGIASVGSHCNVRAFQFAFKHAARFTGVWASSSPHAIWLVIIFISQPVLHALVKPHYNLPHRRPSFLPPIAYRVHLNKSASAAVDNELTRSLNLNGQLTARAVGGGGGAKPLLSRSFVSSGAPSAIY
jgi:hypothetical protein